MDARPTPDAARRAVVLSRASVGVALLVLGLKAWAWAITGSVSLYSDALESVVNVVAAIVALVAVRVAAQPPDDLHPYGHTKAEYLAAVAEGALILFAAVEIGRAAWVRLAAPEAPEALGAGVAVALAATLLNAAWAAVLARGGRRLRSPALRAESHHLWTDVASTAGVLGGLALASATGWWVLDPLMAFAVAAHVLVVGVRLVRDSVGALMDERLPETEMEALHDAIAGAMGGALEAHALRARRAGQSTFVEFHLVVPGAATVAEAHAACDRLEEAIRAAVPGSSVTIHVEPEHKGKGTGGVVRVGGDVPHSFT